ncbi:MAG: chaperonin family protein RbcX [Cyanobacteria bacterium J06642_2]
MDSKLIAKATAKVLISYLTYQAMRTVVNQLRETNPGEAIWLGSFSPADTLQDGEAYLQALMQERKNLALRIMTVREHLANEIVDFLPEMTRTGILQNNTDHRRRMLERMTQVLPEAEAPEEERLSAESQPETRVEGDDDSDEAIAT